MDMSYRNYYSPASMWFTGEVSQAVTPAAELTHRALTHAQRAARRWRHADGFWTKES